MTLPHLRGAALTVTLWLVAGAAQAELTACNTTDQAEKLAIAYSDGSQWLSEGWWSVDPGDCKVLLTGDLTQRHYYYTLAERPDFPGEGYAFCVTSEPFTLSRADGDCTALGGTQRPFSHIDTGTTATGFRFDLKAPGAPVIKSEIEAPMIGVVDHPEDEVAAGATGGFAPGTYGEPFEVNALMQGCNLGEELDGCVFYAEGVRWFAANAAANDPAAMAALADLPVNAPVIVTGDEVSMGDITVEAVVSKVVPGEPDVWASLRDAMQGEWVSVDDAQARLSVVGSEQTDLYGGEVMGVSVVTFADACPGGEKIGPVFFTQMMGGDPADLPCYAVVDLTADRMELSYVGRGNTLVYQRP